MKRTSSNGGNSATFMQSYELFGALRDGVLLCRVMLAVKPNSIPKIHTGTTLNFKIRENVLFFLQAMEDVGVSRFYIFAVADLMEKRNYLKILESLEVLADIASIDHPEKALDTPESAVADDHVFTDEELSQTEELLKRLNVTQIKKVPCKRSLFINEPTTSANRVPHKRTPSSTFVSSSGSSYRPLSSTPSTTSLPIAAVKPRGPALSGVQIIQKARPFEKKWIKIQALIRGHLTRREFHKRVRFAAYRHNIVKEIVSTEEVYVKNLEHLTKVYFQPIQENASKLNIKPEVLKRMFSNIEVIQNYNKSLLDELRPIIEQWSNSKKIGNIFIQFIYLLKVYTQYVKEYSVSYEVVNQNRRNNSKFEAFINEREVVDGKSIGDYLILPVQRIPRYTLLLSDLVKNTWVDHKDYKDLAESLKQMQIVAAYVNEKTREAENIQKVTEIQNNFIGKFENLAEPHRRFVHEGNLSVINPNGKESQRIFYLFNDVLIGTKPVTSASVPTTAPQAQPLLRQSAPPSTTASKPPLTDFQRTRTSTNSPSGIAPVLTKPRTITSAPTPGRLSTSNSPVSGSPVLAPSSAASPPTAQLASVPEAGEAVAPATVVPATVVSPSLMIELVDSFGTCILRMMCPTIKERDRWAEEFKKVQDDLDTRKMVNDDAMKRSQERAGLAKAALSQQYATLRVRGRMYGLNEMKTMMGDDTEGQATTSSSTTSSSSPPTSSALSATAQPGERDFQVLRRSTLRRSQNPTTAGSSDASGSSPVTQSPSISPVSLASVSPKNSKEDLMASLDDDPKKLTSSKSWFSSLRHKKKKGPPSASMLQETFGIHPIEATTSSPSLTNSVILKDEL
eukprot:gene10927-12734_t